MSTDEALSAGELAIRLDIPWQWLVEEATARRLPALRVGNKFFFSELAVRRALAQRAAEPTSFQDVTGGPSGSP